MDLNLAAKKVLITGSSRGIGSSIARTFLDEGADVAIVARGKDNLSTLANELKSEYGENRCIHSVCDCSKEKSLKKPKGFIN